MILILMHIIDAKNIWGDQNRNFLEKVIIQTSTRVEGMKKQASLIYFQVILLWKTS